MVSIYSFPSVCCHSNTLVTGLCGFIGVTFLNVKHNLIHKSGDLDQLMKLGHLSQLHLIGRLSCDLLLW